jgi:hypothetical protein
MWVLSDLQLTKNVSETGKFNIRPNRLHSTGNFSNVVSYWDRLCGLVVRVPGYGSRGPGFDSQRYQIFWEIVALERGPLSLVSTIEELLGRYSSGSGLENRVYGREDPLRWPRDTLYPQKLSLTSPTSDGRSVDIVLLRTKATVFVLLVTGPYIETVQCITYVHIESAENQLKYYPSPLYSQ